MKKDFYSKLKLLTCLIPLLSVTFSCIEPLDFWQETQEGQLIIYGLFTDVDDKHVVNISTSAPLAFRPKSVSNAAVYLLTDGEDRISYSNKGNGVYELHGVKSVEGKSYALEVILNGVTYKSKFQEMPDAVGKDSLSYQVSYEPFRTFQNEYVFKVFAKSEIPETKDQLFLRWIVEEAHYWQLLWIPPGTPPPPPCFIFDVMDPSRVNLFDGTVTSSRQTEKLLAIRKFDNSFLFPYFVTVKQLSINREAFEYWQKINTVINNKGSLFDIPPAPVFGNIINTKNPDELVLGYFEVAKSSVSRFYVTSEISPIYLQPICDYIPGKPTNQYPAECLSCESRAAGRDWTITIPDWWIYD
ncbi:DUF4249 domain-containing protein [Algoriphagus sp.]|uniref:DUF4249 domain-containing protein n=1 Tax=Algoriphagus sp. TaxID=1872435 RepID=UPI0025CF6F98|nr:DUF4249 domain-containing protein [Algoriphagus sp.]